MNVHDTREYDDTHQSRLAILGCPLFPPLAAVPMVCFPGALLTDIVYAQSPNMQWTNFSAWLIVAGLIFALFATVIGVIDVFRTERTGLSIVHLGLVFAAYLVELFNIFVHSRDAYTSVVPTGLTLSIVAVVLLTIGTVLGTGLRYRRSAEGQA